MEDETLHAKVKDACTQLVSLCKAMYDVVETKGPNQEESLGDLMRKVAVSAKGVSQVVATHIEARDSELREKAELQENFLTEYEKNLRQSVVVLVTHARDCFNNSMDYMNKQALNNSLKVVAQKVKVLLEAARALDECDGVVEKGESSSASKPEAAASGGDSGEQAMGSEQADNIGNTVSEQSDILIKNMDVISDAIPENDSAAFEEAYKVINGSIEAISKALAGIPNTENALTGLTDAIMGYITAAKAFLKSPDSEAYANNYTESQKEFSAALKQLVFQVSRRNRLVGRSLSRGFSKRSLTQNLRNSVMSSGANRLVKDSSKPNLASSTSPDAKEKSPPASPEAAVKPAGEASPVSPKSRFSSLANSTASTATAGSAPASAPSKGASATPKVSRSDSKADKEAKADKVDSKSDKSEPTSDKADAKPEKGEKLPKTASKTSVRGDLMSKARELFSSDDKPSSSKLVVVTSDSKTDESETSTSKSKKDKKDKKDKDKREKEKSKDKKNKASNMETSSTKDKKHKGTLGRNTLTASSSSAPGTPEPALKKRKSIAEDISMSEDSPQMLRVKQNKDNMASSEDHEESEAHRQPTSAASSVKDEAAISSSNVEDASSIKDETGKDDSSKSGSMKLSSELAPSSDKSSSGAPMRRINSSELLGEISLRAQRQEEQKDGPAVDDSLIDDSRDEEEEDDKPKQRIRPALSVHVPAGAGQAPGTPGKRSADNDKQQIAQRIIDSFCDRFPGFKAEWEAADPMKKVLTENKIVSELAMYQITLLQTHPGGVPGATATGPTIPTLPLALAAAPSSPVTPEKGSVKVKPGKEKDRPTSEKLSASSKKTVKKANTPASLRLWSGSNPEKMDSPKDHRNTIAGTHDDKEDSSQIDAELERIASIKSPAELGGMTLKLKGGLRSLIGRSPTQKSSTSTAVRLPDNTTTISQGFCSTLLVFLEAVHVNAREPKEYTGEKAEALLENQRTVLAVLKTLVSLLRALTGVQTGVAPGTSVLSDILNRIDDEASLVHEGELNEIDPKLLSECQYAKLAKDNLEASIFRESSGLYYTVAQIGTDMAALVKVTEYDQETEATAIHVLSLFAAFFNLLTLLMNDLLTLHYVVSNTDTKTVSPSPRFAVSSTALWAEAEPEPKDDKDAGPFRTGNLNQLIVRLLTQPNEKFMDTFIDTYSGFATASLLIDKLYEAVSTLPKDKFDKAKCTQVLSAVCDVVKRLIKVGYKYDFDDACTPKIRKLLGELAKTIDVGLQVQQIMVLLATTEQEEKAAEPLYLDVPKEVQIFEGDSLPHCFILSWEASTIAQQLTFIEFDIYKRIGADELKNQSWNKPKRMCIARNVIALIQRANRISMWVATAILLQPKLKERARVMLKIINVAKALKELGNYNTLMGIIAGLNMSCISRLKQTTSTVGRKAMDTLKILQNIVDPTSSFKTLRESLRAGGSTQLPYIGTTLTDITFIEDGNPDTFTHPKSKAEVVNMEKRELLASVIRGVRLYQNSDYKISIKDPPYTFLHELPCLDEQTLYALSLEREPRNADTFRKTRQ